MLCQMIELNVKLMYAGMMQGSFNRNLSMVRNKPLGSVLIELEQIDNSDGHPYFTKDDYDLMFEIKNIRNYWVHKGYASFVYLPSDKWQEGLEIQYNKISDLAEKLERFSKETEEVRLDVMRKFGRIRKD